MIPAETRARAVEMYAAGMSSDVVGRELEISPRTVLNCVREVGGTVRPAKSAGHEAVEGSPNRLTHGRWVRDGLVQRWVTS